MPHTSHPTMQTQKITGWLYLPWAPRCDLDWRTCSCWMAFRKGRQRQVLEELFCACRERGALFEERLENENKDRPNTKKSAAALCGGNDVWRKFNNVVLLYYYSNMTMRSSLQRTIQHLAAAAAALPSVEYPSSLSSVPACLFRTIPSLPAVHGIHSRCQIA